MKKVIFICLLALCFAPLAGAKASATTDLKQKLMGRIVLAVQSHGEAYYISPKDKQIHYLGRPADAFQIMKSQGLGISEKDFTAFSANKPPKSLAGKIILRVESHGEAYYVNPLNLEFNYLGDPTTAFRVMRNLGLGVSNADVTTLLNQNNLISGNVVYKNATLGLQISVPLSWILPNENSSEPEFFSSTSCSKQQSFTCPSFKITSSDYSDGPDADFTILNVLNPVKLTSLIDGAIVIEAQNVGIPTPNDDSLSWDKAYDVFFPAEHKAFVIFAPDRSLENSILPTFKLLK